MIKLLASAVLVMTTLVSPSTGVHTNDEISFASWVDGWRIVAQGDDSYTSPARAWVDPAIIAPGERATITFTEGFFRPGEAVSVTISGWHANDARIYPGDPDVNAARLVSRNDGSLAVIFVAPTDGSGPYVISFEASRAYVAVITVVTDSETSAPGVELTLPKPPAHVPSLPDFTHAGSDDTSPLHAPHPARDEFTTPNPSPSEPMPSDAENGAHGTSDVPSTSDREGRVDLPGTLPQAPAWPLLGDLPWSIALLGAIALTAALVTAGLSIASRRRR